MLVEPSAGTHTGKAKPTQIALPYDASSQITRDYPPPMPPRLPSRTTTPPPRADEPDIELDWGQPDVVEMTAVEKALSDLSDPIPAGEPSQKMAAGSGPAAPTGEQLVTPDRKRAQSRPSMKAVLAGEIEAENELDVPTFLRRHNSVNT
jgi:hypothetical protein